MTNLAVRVSNLGKKFDRLDPHRPRSVAEVIARGWRARRARDVYWALRHISFDIAPGSMVGVIGHNGAGKSTLLRLVGGVGRSDEGSVQVHGRIGALLELGAGFHPDLTGRENVAISGVISGLSRRQVRQRFDDIVAFAELEGFIDNPLRTYSTGMQMRLAFAVAAHIDPEVLLIDEVLAVGDIAFQQKCLRRIADFKANGCTILLVSHDAPMVQELCDEVIWLRQGELVAHGEAEVVVGQYVSEMSAETKKRTPAVQPVIHTETGAELRVNENRFGSQEMEITAVRLLDEEGTAVGEIDSGDALAVAIEYHAAEPIPAPVFGVTISREDGLVCYDTSTEAAGLDMPTIHGRGRIVLDLARLDLAHGHFYIDVGVYKSNWAYAYDYHWHVYPLIVHANRSEGGVLAPPGSWELQPPRSRAELLPASRQRK